MKFKEYVEKAVKLLEDNPGLADAECYYSRDDEGNGFDTVCYEPGIMLCEREDVGHRTESVYNCSDIDEIDNPVKVVVIN